MDRIKEFFKANWADIFKPIIVLCIICIIIPLALAVTNSVTEGRIKALAQKTETDVMKQLVSADDFEKAVYKLDDIEFEYNIALLKGEAVGYIFVEAETGYGGEVSVMTAVDMQGVIKEVAILDVSNETPGLGQNVAKENFYSQYSGKKGEVSVVKNSTKADNEVAAVTGATISSKAVNNAVNRALGKFELVNKKLTQNAEVVPNEE